MYSSSTYVYRTTQKNKTQNKRGIVINATKSTRCINQRGQREQNELKP